MNPALNWDAPEIQALIRSALHEDSARADLTTQIMIDPAWRIEASIVAKQRGIVAGLPLAERFLKALDPAIHFHQEVPDGSRVKPGQVLATVRGKAQSVLSAERPALNALQHLSGIATFAHKQLRKLKGTGAHLYDTRKTLPGWRFLQKYAVRCGGGTNHRMSLGDALLIKENHLEIARMAGCDWVSRVQRAMKKRRSFLQMEIQTERDLRDALKLKPQRALLDNLEPHDLKRMRRILKKAIPGIEIEFTGGIKPEDLRNLAKLRPDRISMGRLTHSTPAFDCSLDIAHVSAR
jgi:nicotinate-nucleotide pyrophosphorylase (carboxylating)